MHKLDIKSINVAGHKGIRTSLQSVRYGASEFNTDAGAVPK